MSQTALCTDTDIRQDACSAFLAPCRAQKEGVGLFHPHTFFFFSFFLPAGLKTPIVLCTQWVISNPVWHLGSWSQGLWRLCKAPSSTDCYPHMKSGTLQLSVGLQGALAPLLLLCCAPSQQPQCRGPPGWGEQSADGEHEIIISLGGWFLREQCLSSHLA